MAKKQAMYARRAAAVAGKTKGGTNGEDEEEEDEMNMPEPEPRTHRSLPPLQLPHWDVGLDLQLDLRLDFPSPTDSYTSGSTTTAPRTPVTPITPTTSTPSIPPGSFHFPRIKAPAGVVATESPARPSTLHGTNPYQRRDLYARGRFRTLSASITARSPLSLSFPLSFSLPLAVRRASSPGVMGGDSEAVVYGEGEDPFGAHGSAYYAALGLGDAYDLSAWAWACDCSPRRRGKKRVRAATTGSASMPVYRAPVHAVSAPQLTYAQHTDVQLEYLRMVANARTGIAGGRVVRMPAPTRTNARESDFAAVPRKGMRPLLLPQKLGLLTIGATSGRERKTENEAERADGWASVRRESRVSGWDVDLERGIWRGGEGHGDVRF